VLDRLRPFTRRQKVWTDADDLERALAFNASEVDLFRLLTGADVLLNTQASLRVAARVNGTRSDEVNRLSDGKVDLARLVGGGPQAPTRMAALRLIGLTLCRKSEPRCSECPLVDACHFASHHRTTLF
jgi:DNA (cytosine-5)-methyltransferase 1